MIDDIDKRILRAWSGLVAAGSDGSADEIAVVTHLDEALVLKRMSALRACGQLPWPEVERAS